MSISMGGYNSIEKQEQCIKWRGQREVGRDWEERRRKEAKMKPGY